MKVLFLCSSYPRSRSDTASIFLRYLATALRDQGAEVEVLAPDDAAVEPNQIDTGITVSHFSYWRRGGQSLAYGSGILPNLRRRPWSMIQVPFFLLGMAVSLYRICRQRRPDLIHAHWIIPQGVIAVMVGRLVRVPVIVTAHGGDAFSLRGKLFQVLKRYSLTRSRDWTANTPATAQVLSDRLGLPGTAHIIPMGVNVEFFKKGDASQLPPNLLAKQDRKVILFVGRLVEKKGVGYLVSAYSSLGSRLRGRSELWIVGDGEQRSELEKQVKEVGLIEQVRFLGVIDNRELPDYYAAADVFVAPSVVDARGDTEGQGVVLIEAMASGVPVIATRTGGIVDVISNEKHGLLVVPAQVEPLTRAIERLLQDDALRQRLIKSAQLRVQQEFDWEKIGKQFMDLFCQP